MNKLAEKIHALAVEKGWWECSNCDGEGWHNWGQDERPPDCLVCEGTGEHRNKAELLMLVVSELSEALEALRQPELDGACDKCDGDGRTLSKRSDRFYDPCPKCKGTGAALGGSRFAEEIADALIRILDICGAYGIDIDAVVAAKTAYNETRPTKHGKAF